MWERKYIVFLKDIDIPGRKEKYFKDVKYRIQDETTESYVVSVKKSITFSKSEEGQLFITGRM